MTKLVIPTDFTVDSLQAVHHAVQTHKGEKLHIILLHLMEIPGDIHDLVMLPREKPYLKLFNNEYRDEVIRLRNQYESQIESIYTDFLYVGVQKVFDGYMESRQVDAIVLHADYAWQLPAKYSLDPVSYIRQCKTPVLKFSSEAFQMRREESYLPAESPFGWADFVYAMKK